MGVAMRGADRICGSLFSYMDLEARVAAEHPLRPIWEIVNAGLAALSGDFAALYSGLERPSIPPEKLLRAMLLQALYSVRSERQFMERIEFDLLFRWFVGIGIDDPVWDHSSFSTNRDLGWRDCSQIPLPCCHSRGSSGCCRANISRSTAR